MHLYLSAVSKRDRTLLALLIGLVLLLPLILYLAQRRQDIRPRAKTAQGPAKFFMVGPTNVEKGESFSVDLYVNNASKNISGVEAHLSYPTNLLEIERATTINTLAYPVVLLNTAADGNINIAAGIEPGGAGGNTPVPTQPGSPTPTSRPGSTPTPGSGPQGDTTQFWNGAKAFTDPQGKQWFPWTDGGPTASWESPVANRIYVCNRRFCWTIQRDTSGASWIDNGQAFDMSTNTGYSTLKPPTNALDVLPWSSGGPTAAWSWSLTNLGNFPDLPASTLIYETLICNKNYCWRHLRHPTNGSLSRWKDDGRPIYLPTHNEVWSRPEVSTLWTGNGITVAWTDYLNSQTTFCNNTYCWSLNYTNWTWSEQINMGSWPTQGVPLTASWTSPLVNFNYRCKEQTCWIFNLASLTWENASQPVILHPSP